MPDGATRRRRRETQAWVLPIRVLELLQDGPLAVPEMRRRLDVPAQRLYTYLHALAKQERLELTRHGRYLIACLPGDGRRPATPLLELYEWLQENPGLDQATIMRHWQEHGWQRTSIQYRLRKLEAQGLAHRRGPRRGATWYAD